MKVSVSQQQLAQGLGIVSKAVSPRSTLPVLANVLLATDDGGLRLAATNLELGISSWVSAQIEEEGSITVPARLLTDMVGTLPNETVHITANLNNFSIEVRCGTTVSEIKGIDAQEFPPMPAADDSAGVRIKLSDFKEMIQLVTFAASTDETRPVLQGIQTILNGNEISMASTDGYRISVCKAALQESIAKPITMIIPARALNELARIATDKDSFVTLIMPEGRGQVVFRLETAELVSQLIDGSFPDYKAIMPRSFKSHTVLSTSTFLKACKSAEIIARNSNKVVRLTIQPNEDRPGQLEVSALSEETGSNQSVVDATIEGPGLVIAFNVFFLREVLEAIKTPSVVLETNDQKSPARVQAVGDDKFLHIIMPMSIN